jgi:hypothetical protein
MIIDNFPEKLSLAVKAELNDWIIFCLTLTGNRSKRK